MSVDEIPDGIRKCPFCAELIRSEAKICRFCQRDLPAERSEASPTVTGSDAVEPWPLWYGDRISSPIMGNGMVVGNELDGDAVLVRFDSDHIQRTVALSELELDSNPAPSVRAVPSSRPNDTLIVAAWATAFSPAADRLCLWRYPCRERPGRPRGRVDDPFFGDVHRLAGDFRCFCRLMSSKPRARETRHGTHKTMADCASSARSMAC